jgi:hypothetical protein
MLGCFDVALEFHGHKNSVDELLRALDKTFDREIPRTEERLRLERAAATSGSEEPSELNPNNTVNSHSAAVWRFIAATALLSSSAGHDPETERMLAVHPKLGYSVSCI